MPSDNPNPISLSDEQLQTILTAGEALHPSDHDAFLRSVAERLRHQAIGDGAVSRAVRDAQREFFRAPVDNVRTKAPHHNRNGNYKLV